MSSSNTNTNTKKSSKQTSPVNKNSVEMTHHTSITDDDESEDEIKRYSTDKDGLFTRIAVFEGDYIRFVKELENGKLIDDENNITEFEKMVKQKG